MEKTLIRQNAQWNGKMFDHLCPRDIMDNLLKKKTMRHVQIPPLRFFIIQLRDKLTIVQITNSIRYGHILLGCNK